VYMSSTWWVCDPTTALTTQTQEDVDVFAVDVVVACVSCVSASSEHMNSTTLPKTLCLCVRLFDVDDSRRWLTDALRRRPQTRRHTTPTTSSSGVSPSTSCVCVVNTPDDDTRPCRRRRYIHLHGDFDDDTETWRGRRRVCVQSTMSQRVSSNSCVYDDKRRRRKRHTLSCLYRRRRGCRLFKCVDNDDAGDWRRRRHIHNRDDTRRRVWSPSFVGLCGRRRRPYTRRQRLRRHTQTWRRRRHTNTTSCMCRRLLRCVCRRVCVNDTHTRRHTNVTTTAKTSETHKHDDVVCRRRRVCASTITTWTDWRRIVFFVVFRCCRVSSTSCV
jgi:hypothetical protein